LGKFLMLGNSGRRMKMENFVSARRTTITRALLFVFACMVTQPAHAGQPAQVIAPTIDATEKHELIVKKAYLVLVPALLLALVFGGVATAGWMKSAERLAALERDIKIQADSRMGLVDQGMNTELLMPELNAEQCLTELNAELVKMANMLSEE